VQLLPSQNIDPQLLLAVFLPVLLFASAFIAHWHTVRRQAVPILLLVRLRSQPSSMCASNRMADLRLMAAFTSHHPLCLQAFPGVLIAMSSIAVLMRYSFPYGWTWTQALLFGAMMAATDPVATIAVLGSVSMASLLIVIQTDASTTGIVQGQHADGAVSRMRSAALLNN
jgi:NhaP-type Na+/H+ or K+/H+ antiporter